MPRVKTADKSDLARLMRLVEFDAGKLLGYRVRQLHSCLVGTDEVGRGCLAGPVIAAAVVLPDIASRSALAASLQDLDDSKKLHAKQRERLSAALKEVSAWSIGEASVAEIDQLNILNASMLAMKRALIQLVEQLSVAAPYLVLVDGNRKIPKIAHEQIAVVGGDSLSASIAAASVIAKVHRDVIMTRLSEEFPAYLWHQNKGYGTRAHCQALLEHGLTHLHRKVFCSRLMAEAPMDRQLSLALDSNQDG